jgi:hypothetical protein
MLIFICTEVYGIHNLSQISNDFTFPTQSVSLHARYKIVPVREASNLGVCYNESGDSGIEQTVFC